MKIQYLTLDGDCLTSCPFKDRTSTGVGSTACTECQYHISSGTTEGKKWVDCKRIDTYKQLFDNLELKEHGNS